MPEIIPAKPILRVDEGSSFHLLCQARAGDFQLLTWEKRNGRQSAVSSEFRRNQYNLTRTISVAHAEIDDSGEYHCVGWTNNATRISVIVVEVKGEVVILVSFSFFLNPFTVDYRNCLCNWKRKTSCDLRTRIFLSKKLENDLFMTHTALIICT